jgi:drug/metabolite transporter (DMT)-like permease
LLTAIWGTTWAAIQIGLRGLPPFTGVSVRFALAGVMILLYAWARGIRLGREARERRLWLVTGGLAFAGSYGIIYWGEQWVPSGLTSVLFATFPLFVAILAHFLLPGERLPAMGALGILIGFAGTGVIFSEDLRGLGGGEVAKAAAIILVSPFVSAVSSVAVKRWGAGIPPASLTGIPMLGAAAVLGAIAVATERHRPLTFDATSIGALLYLAIAGTVVTFLLYYWLLANVRATQAALLAYLIPLVAVAVGVLWLDEPMTGRILTGSMLVVAGVALTLHASHGR